MYKMPNIAPVTKCVPTKQLLPFTYFLPQKLKKNPPSHIHAIAYVLKAIREFSLTRASAKKKVLRVTYDAIWSRNRLGMNSFLTFHAELTTSS